MYFTNNCKMENERLSFPNNCNNLQQYTTTTYCSNYISYPINPIHCHNNMTINEPDFTWNYENLKKFHQDHLNIDHVIGANSYSCIRTGDVNNTEDCTNYNNIQEDAIDCTTSTNQIDNQQEEVNWNNYENSPIRNVNDDNELVNHCSYTDDIGQFSDDSGK